MEKGSREQGEKNRKLNPGKRTSYLGNKDFGENEITESQESRIGKGKVWIREFRKQGM